MAEFDFAPRPPKQDDQVAPSPFAAGDPAKADKSKRAGRFASADASDTARRNPAESQGMLAGLMSMATTMGMARHATGHMDPISSPTGLLGMIKASAGAKHEKTDDHSFNLDLTRNASAGGGIGGTSTGLGTVGGPVQSTSKRESTNEAMRAIGGMARASGGGLTAMLSAGAAATRRNMQWLHTGVRNLYKVER